VRAPYRTYVSSNVCTIPHAADRLPEDSKPGAMPQVFYVHGSGHTADSFREQANAFAGSAALSLPGHPSGIALDSVEQCASWLARRMEESGAMRAVVAGNSLGGAIALQWALDHPAQAAGIVLVGTGARLRVSPEIFKMIDNDWPACIDTLVDWSLGKDPPAELRARAKSWHLAVGKETTRKDYAACNAFDVIERLPELRLPALIVVGSQDRMTPVKYSAFLHEHIPGSELMVVPDAGHLVMAEQPVRVNAALASFIESVS